MRMATLLEKINNNICLDKYDIIDIIHAYIEKNNLELYLVDVVFDNNSKYIGAYNMKDKTITLNDDRIIKFCYKTSNNLSRIYNIDEDYYNYFFNYYYLYVIFHELEHVLQTKKYENERNKNVMIFKFLYELCQKLHYNSPAFYHFNHDLFPMEIDANNNGYLKSYKFLSHTNLPKRELKIMQTQYTFSLLYNYKKIDNTVLSPLDKLCENGKNISKEFILKLLSACELSMDERLNLGLNITSLEFNNIEKEKRKIILLKR